MEKSNESNESNASNVDYTPLFENVQKEGLELFKKKNADYGNAFEEFGTIGILIRMNDKIKRAMSISNSGVILVESESIRDTLIDLHNYCALAVALLDSKK